MTQNRARKSTQARPPQKKAEAPKPQQNQNKPNEEAPPVAPSEDENSPQTPDQGDGGGSDQETPTNPADGQGDASGDSPEDIPTPKTVEVEPEGEEPEDIADRIPEPPVDTDPKEDVGPVEPGDKPSKERKAPDGVIIEPGDPIRIEGTLIGDQVLVTRDHFRKVIPYRSLRATYTLVYTKGTLIPKNLLVNLSEGDDEDNKNSISGEMKK